jgi:hypothetical protein
MVDETCVPPSLENRVKFRVTHLTIASNDLNEMEVTVIVTTYNHEKYIAQVLDSVLMQETDFDYETVVLEDCSTDDPHPRGLCKNPALSRLRRICL